MNWAEGREKKKKSDYECAEGTNTDVSNLQHFNLHWKKYKHKKEHSTLKSHPRRRSMLPPVPKERTGAHLIQAIQKLSEGTKVR